MRRIYGKASSYFHLTKKASKLLLNEAAFELTVKTIKGAVQKAGFLKMSDKLGEDEKKEYRAILDENMSEATLFWSLKNLSELLEKHYETKVILLIDEYDVPLAKAFENGYYDKMVFLSVIYWNRR